MSKKPAEPHIGTARAGALAAFAERGPSQAWEQVRLGGGPQEFVWVWFKPAHVPQGLMVRAPDEAFQGAAPPPALRAILQAAGIDPASIWVWYLYGVAYDAMQGTNPLLDAPIPAPPAGVEPTIVIYMPAPAGDPMQPAAYPAAGVMPAPVVLAPVAADESVNATELFERMETDWNAAQELEKDLTRLRKQLVDMMTKVKALNRDLTPQERLHGNNQDKKDWQDARRWLREGANRLWRCIKEHDIGDTSTAGQRNRFENTYRQYVVPRVPFDGVLQAQRDFESYRKSLQTLHNNMSTAHSIASLDGERRAQQILNRIAAKIREASTKKNFLGVIAD